MMRIKQRIDSVDLGIVLGMFASMYRRDGILDISFLKPWYSWISISLNVLAVALLVFSGKGSSSVSWEGKSFTRWFVLGVVITVFLMRIHGTILFYDTMHSLPGLR